MIRLCFKLACAAGLVSVALWAAEPVDTETAVSRRITTVIHPDKRTGKLVRSVIVTSKPVAERSVAGAPVAPHVVSPLVGVTQTSAPPAGGIDEAIEQIAAQVALPSQLIHSVIKVESNYDPYAISPKGAQGLMQLIPATARRFGVSNVFNPAENIQGGSKYLKYLLDLYGGNYALALAAYNAGEAAVATVWRQRAAVPRDAKLLDSGGQAFARGPKGRGRQTEGCSGRANTAPSGDGDQARWSQPHSRSCGGRRQRALRFHPMTPV